MGAFSIDLRERIVAACDRKQETQQQVADRFEVSLAFVKKLLKQRKKLGHIRPLYDRVGVKRKITDEQIQALTELVEVQPDLTLKELRDTLQLDCTEQSVHRLLKQAGFTYKKNAVRQRTRS